MPAPKRADVDRSRIHSLYTNGASPYSIANMLKEEGTKLSKQAIMQRAEREGWKAPAAIKRSPDNKSANSQTSVTATPSPAPQASKPAAVPAPVQKATAGSALTLEMPPERKEVIRNIAEVGSCKYASLALGVDEDTFTEWLQDPNFKAQTKTALGVFAAKNLGNIAKAADRGEWRAAEALLRLSPDTRDDFAPQEKAGKGGLVVNFKFDLVRGAIPREEDIITIEQPGRG
jgi:hypothetical protein